MRKSYRSEKGESCLETAITIALVLFIVILFFNGPIRGSLVKSERAEQAAKAQLEPYVELGPKQVFFVHWKGCENGDVAVFKVLPYKSAEGVIVTNAIVCDSWPFKGATVRFK